MARTEDWTIRTTQRPTGKPARPGKDDATMRTNTGNGIRAGGKIDIRVEVQGSGPGRPVVPGTRGHILVAGTRMGASPAPARR